MAVKNYETVFIFTPVLKDVDQRKVVKEYVDFLKENGAEILEEDFWGMRQLAYPIKKKTTGIYFVTEYRAEGETVDAVELKSRRDTNVLRFLTVKLEKYAIKYNDEKRQGLVGRNKKKVAAPAEEASAETESDNANNS